MQDQPNPKSDALITDEKPVTPWKMVLWRLKRNTFAMAGFWIVVVMLFIVTCAPFITTHTAEEMDYSAVLQPPGSEYFFGTDDLGRDVYSRVVFGGRESLKVGFIGIFVALAGGVILGVWTAYVGGWVDTFTQRLTEVFLAFPAMLLLLSIVAILGPGLTTIIIALGISSIPVYSRMVRGSVLSIKEREYITAAQALGASDISIMARHVIPNIIGPILVYGTLGLSGAILLTAGLSYIGLGAQPPSPEWGAMLNYGRGYLASAWWMSIFPGLGIFFSVLGINMLGDGLRDALDPKAG
jgi:peptide/nickel transport system permease protein